MTNETKRCIIYLSGAVRLRKLFCEKGGENALGKAINILVLVIASLVVITACVLNIAGLIGGLRSGITEEWVDFLKWNDRSYINTYGTLDKKYVNNMLGATSRLTPKSVDMTTYVPGNGEAAHLEIGTAFYSINGYDSEKFIAVKDGSDFFLYCTQDADSASLLEKCGVKRYKSQIGFGTFFVQGTGKGTDSDISLKYLKSYSALTSYLSDKSKDFSGNQYKDVIMRRGYDEDFFLNKAVIAIRLGSCESAAYDLNAVMSGKSEMTFVLRKNVLPDEIRYAAGDVGYLFVEINRRDYDGQKLVYQIEPDIIENAEILAGEDAESAMNARVKIAYEYSEISGTPWAIAAGEEYDRDFFDSNLLFIVSCGDSEGLSRYSLDSVSNERGILKINITRCRNVNASPDYRRQYITVAYPKSRYNGETVLPIAKLSDAPPEPTEYTPRDCTVITDMDTLTELAAVYGIPENIYGDKFFESYVLYFVGDVVASEDVDFSYMSCRADETGQTITVKETVPADCDDSPVLKYVAVPYLKSAYGGGGFTVLLETKYEYLTENGYENTENTEETTDETAVTETAVPEKR